jgi:hypothetical protein
MGSSAILLKLFWSMLSLLLQSSENGGTDAFRLPLPVGKRLERRAIFLLVPEAQQSCRDGTANPYAIGKG